MPVDLVTPPRKLRRCERNNFAKSAVLAQGAKRLTWEAKC